MAIIQFVSDKEENLEAVQESIGSYPLTCLSQRDESKSPVYIVPDHVLFELDENGIKYFLLKEEDLPERLSDGGFQYYRGLKEARPELIDLSKIELPKPGETGIIVACETWRGEEAFRVLESFGYREIGESLVDQINIGSEEGAKEKIEFRGFIPENNFDAVVKELAEKRIAGYSRETKVLRGMPL